MRNKYGLQILAIQIWEFYKYNVLPRFRVLQIKQNSSLIIARTPQPRICTDDLWSFITHENKHQSSGDEIECFIAEVYP